MNYFFVLVLVLISGCSFAPLPIQVNLLEGFADAKGSFEITTPSSQFDLLSSVGAEKTGMIGPFSSPFAVSELDIIGLAGTLGIDIIMPNAQGFDIDFRDQTLPAELNAATLEYRLALSKTGPVTAKLKVQPYLAPVNAEKLIQAKYALGEAKHLNFNVAQTNLSDAIVLTKEQLAGINQQRLRLALAIEGGSLSFSEAGEASLAYELTALKLKIANVTTAINETVPNAEGIFFDFRDQEIPDPNRIKNLGVSYVLHMNIQGEVQGVLSSQVYLAPEDIKDSVQDKYLLGSPQRLDLSKTSLVIRDKANFNQEQLKMLETKTAKLVMLITGDSSLGLSQTLSIDYEFTKLELFGGYSLN